MNSFGNKIDLPKYMTQEQVKRFFGVIARARDRALFSMIYHYGLRETEALLLTLNDIDFTRARITIRRLKNGISGEKPLWKHTAKTLKAYLKERLPKGDALFTGRHGPLSSRMIRHLFQMYAKQAGIVGFRVHSLRHSIAVHLLDAGQPLELVCDHLGHKNIANTAIYARISSPKRAQFFQAIEYHPAVVKV